jgi:Kef-type K+ transport system membrane component KefB
MDTSGSIVLIAIGFVAFFVVLWCFILWLASWVSGWRRLAERFASTFEYGGEVVAFVSARIGIANYSGMLILGAGDQGLYLVPIRIYRLFHPPLLIPWTEIVADVHERAVVPRVRLTFPSVPGKRILFYGRSAKACMPYVRPESSFDT